ncbi:ADP-dependent glucokinase [Paramuricea clavata]|uniref:ADP-dependent glucokinase n=1 Tax=Paramuricea clavata TaxID=317549 RepID=A0A6S7FW73_PARCT|nr:ADP-dependent glucokinase [Paramuricea clavata]
MGENTEFNEDMLLSDNVNLTGYSDTDDDDDGDDNDDRVNAEDNDNWDNTDPTTGTTEDVVVDENIHPFDENNDASSLNIADEVQLQDQVVKKKKENQLIPSVANFMKLDFDQKSQRITPTIIRHLLHICDLIVRNKLDIKIDHGDRGVLEYITSKDCPKKDIKFMFVENMRIHDELLNNAKRSAEEAGLIESRQEVKKSVKNNTSTAGNDIINFLRKTESYRKSAGLDQTEEDKGVAPGNAAAPVTAGVSGAAHKPGTVASSTAKIEEHFRKNGVKPIPQGIKFADGQLGISYQDMIEDLTRNYTQTQPNLNEKNRHRVLLLLKKTNMPISYIRNKRIKEDKFLNTDDIDKLARANAVVKKYYLGCYPANNYPKNIKDRCCWVWNTDEDDKPGTHWVCVVKDRQDIVFFDSFGKTPRFFGRKYWLDYFRSLRCNYSVYMQLPRQSYISKTCGAWCLLFLNSFYNNDDIIDIFSVKQDELLENEKKLQELVYREYPNMINIYKRKCSKGKGQICKTYLEAFQQYM